MIKPTPFEIDDYLRDVGAPFRSMIFPCSPELREKMMSILSILEHSCSVVMLVSTKFELNLYFNSDACVYLSAESSDFEEKLLRCIRSGKYTFVTDNVKREHQH